MDKDKLVHTIITILFIAFIGLYVSNKTGYYEYEMHKKVELTNEQIERFENDVKSNANIDLNDYLSETNIDYSNGFSKASLSFSKFTGNKVKQGINGLFKLLNKILS